MKTGCSGNFFWLRSSELGVLDVLQVIDLPEKPFRVVVTYWDWGGGAAFAYGDISGWSRLGEYAISDTSTVLPKLQFGADNAQMLLDEVMSEHEVLQNLLEFDEPYLLDDLENDQVKAFWIAIEALRPYCYFSYCEGLTLIMRGTESCKEFIDRVSLEEVETIFRGRTTSYREKKWNELGPECGPEVCIEENCDRLRIKLAVRCFIHQLQWGGSL